MDVLVDLICLFFLEKVANSFHHNYLLQKWHMFLQLIEGHRLIKARGIISKVQVTHNKLGRNFNLTPGPGCCEFPTSAERSKGIMTMGSVGTPPLGKHVARSS